MSARLKRFIWSILALALFIFLLGHVGACSLTLSPLGHGYRAVSYLAKARDTAAAAIQAYCQPKFDNCRAEHGTDNDAFRACLEGCPKAVSYWHKIAYPVVQASIEATLGSLEAARAKEQKDWNWIKVALPAVCGLLSAVKELKPLIGNRADKVLDYLDLGKAYVCP